LTNFQYGSHNRAAALAQNRSAAFDGSHSDFYVFMHFCGGECAYGYHIAGTQGGIVEGQIDIGSVMVKAGLVKSKSEARTAIQQGGVTVDDVKITDVKTAYTKADLADGKLFRKGKKTFVKIIAK
jgi:hypothetical protein